MGHIVVLTPNPAIDVTYRVSSQKVGETHRVLEPSKRAGGKGINVARILKMLGHDAVCVLPLGGTAGTWIRSELKEAGISLAIAEIAEEVRTTVAIIDSSHHPTLFSERGPELNSAEIQQLTGVLRDELHKAPCLVISGSLPPGVSPADLADWVTMAHRAGVKVIVDASGAALVAAATAGADIAKANEIELRDATSTIRLDDGIAALRMLGARTVVISRGSQGLEAMSDDETYVVSAIPELHGNPTGAGDAATAGLASALVEGLPLLEGLRRAAALGAAAVLSPVAGEMQHATYLGFLARYHTEDGTFR